MNTSTSLRLGFALALALRLPLFAAPQRPAAAEIQNWVVRLGAETHAEREEAQKKLQAWAEAFPLHLLGALAEQYRSVDDVEVQLRLEQLLRPLAMDYMFDLPPGFLGVNLAPFTLDSGEEAILISSIQPGHAAARADLRAEDLILAVDGKTIAEMGGQAGFMNRIAQTVPGSRIELLVQRAGKRFVQSLEIGPRPDDAARVERRQQAEKEVAAWLLRLSGKNNGDADFPVGHFPLD